MLNAEQEEQIDRWATKDLVSWSWGLIVLAGQQVQHVGRRFIALNDGVTAGTQGPTQVVGDFTDDGGIVWRAIPRHGGDRPRFSSVAT
jgi:hypothetical protein